MRIAYTLLLCCSFASAADVELPPAAKGHVDFAKQIQPLLKTHCAKCHSGETRKGGFSINTRRTILDGSESEDAVVVGNSAKSLLIERVAETDADLRMPPKGNPALTAKQIGLLRAWIDRGMYWPKGFAFGKLYRQAPLAPRTVALPAVPGVANPVDRLLHPYFLKHRVVFGGSVADRAFARRVWMDLVGLLPPGKELADFVRDSRDDKHARLVRRLLSDRRAYADHWTSWWSDLLRNDYRGTGYIDGGRRQITGWLYKSLYDDKPYDRFTQELLTGTNGAGGFIWGIKWRGTVNDSQRREMQAAQNVAQVFLGTNLKCASCHDSFVNQWKLKQSYAFASVFATKPLQLHRCNKPTGKISKVAFLYPQLGRINPKASRSTRLKQLAGIVTGRKNGRFTRTIVNRLWERFFGRGLVEPLDDMDQPAWNRDLLDWLAEDLALHKYDLKRTMTLICTSRAYRMPAVGAPEPNARFTAFRGPFTKRMSAEQFVDAVSTLTGEWAKPNGRMRKRDGRGQGGQLAAILRTLQPSSGKRPKPPSRIRCVLTDTGELVKALGRPIREQVVTRRESVATTLQCLELTNGKTLDSRLKSGARRWLKNHGNDNAKLVRNLYLAALSRLPTETEARVAGEILGDEPTEQSVQDLLWIVTMLPEFQLVR
ncbi:MAG: DUF1549 domain-containing protein [Planctomycetaceae bacterium]